MGRYELVVFDLDGTLVDSSGDIQAALNHALNGRGITPPAGTDIALEISAGLESFLIRIGVPKKDLEAVAGADRSFYKRNLVAHTHLYPGVASSLAALAPVVRAVATNKAGDLARRVLTALDVSHHFAMVVGFDDVNRAKPDPLLIQHVCERRGIAAE